MKMTKRKFRPFAWFIFPDSEREEPFLNEMSEAGWHLVKTRYWRYTFQKGEPVEYQYRVDYISEKPRHSEYMQILEDAGWEMVDTRLDEFGRWVFCRKPRAEAETLELYTDAESKIEAMRRIRMGFCRSVIVALGLVPVLFGIGFLNEGNFGLAIGGLIGGGIATIFGYILISRKIKRIRNDTL
jgi:hypothetical protein